MGNLTMIAIFFPTLCVRRARAHATQIHTNTNSVQREPKSRTLFICVFHLLFFFFCSLSLSFYGLARCVHFVYFIAFVHFSYKNRAASDLVTLCSGTLVSCCHREKERERQRECDGVFLLFFTFWQFFIIISLAKMYARYTTLAHTECANLWKKAAEKGERGKSNGRKWW